MANKSPLPSPPAALVVRLSPAAYKGIEQKCNPLFVGQQTTELQAAFTLGQQSVLAIIREDLVIDPTR